jgi:hypothetical protein
VGDIGTLIVDGSVTWQVASRVPFAVQAVPTEINGQPVPAGVYIDAAYVLNATIQNAQIADLAVDDQKITSLNVGKLTAGSLQTDSYVQSSNYVAGAQGFRISANGQAEFQNAVVRGAVFAESGTFSGSLEAATGTFAGSLSAATGSFAGSLSAATGSFAGTLSAATGSFAGSLSAATGSFAGELSAATGTFSGSLTADAVNAVRTINIADNSVTISATASGNPTGAISTNISIPPLTTTVITVTAQADAFGGWTQFGEPGQPLSFLYIDIDGVVTSYAVIATVTYNADFNTYSVSFPRNIAMRSASFTNNTSSNVIKSISVYSTYQGPLQSTQSAVATQKTLIAFGSFK